MLNWSGLGADTPPLASARSLEQHPTEPHVELAASINHQQQSVLQSGPEFHQAEPDNHTQENNTEWDSCILKAPRPKTRLRLLRREPNAGFTPDAEAAPKRGVSANPWRAGAWLVTPDAVVTPKHRALLIISHTSAVISLQ
ncbi:unnamed protein product [Pleuronectes platessa]|uniref:Uncharacterized protein n=1 Tax=Pleuronectes platessa TaxID=8262 RepID=A0A9N7VN20_PLEPL|nr:unnamed protein product [Pleuronectes platessa]